MKIDFLSLAGSYHGSDQRKNEDYVCFGQNEEFSALILADGISSCSRSGKGAKTACGAAMEHLLSNGRSFFDKSDSGTVPALLGHVKNKLRDLSKRENEDIGEYSSTLACVLIDKKSEKLFYLNLGDGLIITVNEDKCRIAAMPADSRDGCVSTTDDIAAGSAVTGVIEPGYNGVMLCSDGAWKLMYKNTVLKPEFKSLITSGNYDELKKQLQNEERQDDCSFISAVI